MIYIFWTCKNKEEAKRIIFGLLDKHLVACASILPEMESIYRWKGKIEEGKEVKVILKTQAERFDSICNYIVENGSYRVPEILQVDVPKGNPCYLSWVKDETEVTV
jgi:periplasmic divalent cation tolerance protein